MIGSANDTSWQPVSLRDELGLISDDGMAITSTRRGAATTAGGPYREGRRGARPNAFYVVDVVETSVALVAEARALDTTVRGQVTQALLQRHSVVVLLDAAAPSAAALGVASRSLEPPAAVMMAARATAALRVIGGWDPSTGFVFVAREARPGRTSTPHHVVAEARWQPPRWRVAARRPEHEWPALRARFGSGAFVGVDVAGTRAFLARHGPIATDLMLARVEAALRRAGARMGAVFARGANDEFVLGVDYAKGPPLGEAALAAVRALELADGAAGTVGVHVAVVSGAPAATVPQRLQAAVAEAAKSAGAPLRVHLG